MIIALIIAFVLMAVVIGILGALIQLTFIIRQLKESNGEVTEEGNEDGNTL